VTQDSLVHVRQPDDLSMRGLADTVSELRGSLRRGIRATYPWEVLPAAQVEILQRLAQQPQLRVNELAAQLRLAPNTVSTLTRQMAGVGLLTAQEDPLDGRVRRLSLSEGGRSQLEAWQQAQEEMLAGAVCQLDRADRDAIIAAIPALFRLVRVLEGQDAQK
jgi:DNA-binding MarR family transcriptional regulator